MKVKGLILAGGTGSRLAPLTLVTNKHLLPIGDKPMIYHVIEKLTESGIYDIMVVTGKEHMGDVIGLLGSGKDFNCGFTYRVQDEPNGIAGAVKLSEAFVGDDKFCIILGDNIFEDSFKNHVNDFRDEKSYKHYLFLKKVDDPKRYGTAVFYDDECLHLKKIEEKPKKPKSDYAVTGFYMYSPEVFSIIKTLKPSARGELEITDVNNALIEDGKVMSYKLKGRWTDAGTFESYRAANELIWGKNGKN